jgi:hypothetical protein
MVHHKKKQRCSSFFSSLCLSGVSFYVKVILIVNIDNVPKIKQKGKKKNSVEREKKRKTTTTTTADIRKLFANFNEQNIYLGVSTARFSTPLPLMYSIVVYRQ